MFLIKKKIHIKITKKVRDHCHFTEKFRGVAHSICNLRYCVPHKIPIIFHNGWKYDFHFIIKELAEECKEEDSKCLAENSEKYLSFSVPIKKEGIEDTNETITYKINFNETITYKIKFIDSFRFMRCGLSGLVDNLSEINNKKIFR